MEGQDAPSPTSQPDPLAPPPAATALAVVLRRLVSWDPLTGQPIVKVAPMLTREQITEAITASLALPYEPDPRTPEDQRYAGMTNLEVQLHKRSKSAARSGSTDDSEALLDRVLGKPKTTAESLRVTIGYEDYLKDIASKTPPPQSESQPIDAEIVPEDPLA